MKAIHSVSMLVLAIAASSAFAAAPDSGLPQPAAPGADLQKAMVLAQNGPKVCAANGTRYPAGAKVCRGETFMVCKADGTWTTTSEKCGER